jgi:hypothetical protein
MRLMSVGEKHCLITWRFHFRTELFFWYLAASGIAAMRKEIRQAAIAGGRVKIGRTTN